MFADNEVIQESILPGLPNIISYDCSKKIIEQMEKYICKIKTKIAKEQDFLRKYLFQIKIIC